MSTNKKSLREIIRNFAPSWFTVNMGTGSISILFHAFPYGGNTHTLKLLSLIFFFLNLFLFVVFNIMTITRHILFRDIWNITIHHPIQSLFLGTYPIGATTLITVAINLIFEVYRFGGKGFLYAIWSLWWFYMAVSLACCWILVHVMITRQDHALSKMTLVWLFPVITLIVGASAGGVLVNPLQEFSASHALLTLTFSVFMLTIGFTLAFMMLTLYLLRLIVHGQPPGASILSSFFPLGVTGQTGFTLLLIGLSFKSLLPLQYGNSKLLTSSTTGDIINVICIYTAFVLWSLGVMWTIFALLAVQDVLRETRFPFKVTHWGLIFPNGVFANCTIQLGQIFDSTFFRVLGAIYAVATLILWVWVATNTVILVWNGSIFEDPSLANVFVRTFVEENQSAEKDPEESPRTGRSATTSITHRP